MYTLSLHDALPISDAATSSGPLTPKLWRFGVIPFLSPAGRGDYSRPQLRLIYALTSRNQAAKSLYPQRSEEHTSELQSRRELVCRLLLEKKNNYTYKPLAKIMIDIHQNCYETPPGIGAEGHYVVGANINGFLR